MARTNSARSSVSRDQASSPPKAKIEQQSQRATRSTRSQSKELGGDHEAVNSRRAGKRGARQASADSVDSNTSATSSKASSRGGRSRKVVRKGAAARGKNLSLQSSRRANNIQISQPLQKIANLKSRRTKMSESKTMKTIAINAPFHLEDFRKCPARLLELRIHMLR